MNQNFSWQSILQRLCADEPVILLLVVASEGSAPGKPGFVMAVSKEKTLQGSIGGGAVEYELVEYAHKLLHSGINPDTDSNIDSDIVVTDTPYNLHPELLYRSHNGSGAEDDSGMVCGGSQQVVLYPLHKKHVDCIQKLVEHLDKGLCTHLCFSPSWIGLEPWKPEQEEPKKHQT
ncbi:MAG: XdhC family protein, partial [Candidatus Electrothrix sp. ATG1]|nr:XdhC family protein [Candidatus Electrothrix sp. ATG1]